MKDDFSIKTKIYRELKRLLLQFINLPKYIFQYFFNNIYYAFWLDKKKILSQGKLPFGKKIAIFLILPNKGLTSSHKKTINHLIKKGFTPLIVSNVQLSGEDKNTLIEISNFLIQRPNFGYDFGGYRDGILHIQKKLHSLESLVLINDSCWFPVNKDQNRDWLDFVNNSNLDFIGASSHFGFKKPSFKKALNKLSELDYNFTSTSKNFHYASFALAISNKILKDPSFLKYWKTLKLSGKKNIVVRRGEIGLTQWVLNKQSYTHGSLLDLSSFPEILEKCSVDELSNIVRNLIVENNKLLKLKNFYISNLDLLSKLELINLIMFNISRYNIAYSMADYIINNLDFPFFKKIIFKLNKDSAELGLKIAKEKNLEEEVKSNTDLNLYL
jgi:lipopolysaccharide biosynthesis protein